MTSRIASPLLAETSLYAPVKAFLEGQGFEAKGETCVYDIVAVRSGEPSIIVITELKLSFTLELLLQAVDRMRAADQVYLAIPASRRGRNQDARVQPVSYAWPRLAAYRHQARQSGGRCVACALPTAA